MRYFILAADYPDDAHAGLVRLAATAFGEVRLSHSPIAVTASAKGIRSCDSLLHQPFEDNYWEGERLEI